MGMKLKSKIIDIDDSGIFAPENGSSDLAASFFGHCADGDQINVFFSLGKGGFGNLDTSLPGHDVSIDEVHRIFDHGCQQALYDGGPHR